MINSGGVYRLSRLQQVDLHLAFGLNHNAPDYIVGPGYSFRVDGLFAGLTRQVSAQSATASLFFGRSHSNGPVASYMGGLQSWGWIGGTCLGIIAKKSSNR
jgi:hypothetical protein